MDRRLDSLDPVFRPLAIELLARLTEAGIPVCIVQTLRTPEEHAANLAAGRSWVNHSKHLDGLAIDLCPFETYHANGPDKLNWDADAVEWEQMGMIGEACGLTWGGRWKQRDMGHFEIPVHHVEGHPV